MRMAVAPRGRANYQPNGWGEGPRESPERGFRSFAATEAGPKLRLRPESFADHYSQARQFYLSQTEVEQAHIAAALTFELSKVETPVIRARIVAHLRNIEDGLARRVAEGLGLPELPAAAPAAQPTRTDLEPSPALSILLNGPTSFAGRRVGALVTDGVEADLLAALRTALEQEGAVLKIVAPKVGGVKASDGSLVAADEQIDGGPSVLFDAVALLPSAEGATLLAQAASARDFVADAFAHLKFIGCNDAAGPLLAKAGLPEARDAGCLPLNAATDAAGFVTALRALRFWAREPEVRRA